MARGINKVILIGNLGADPDMRSLPSGDPVANLSLATSEGWNDKQSGEKREKTEWHRVVAFGKLAEIIGQYCRKGSKLYIEGRLQTRKWTDSQGIEKYSTEIIANDMQMLDSRGGDGGGYDNNYGGGYDEGQSSGYDQGQGQPKNNRSGGGRAPAPNKNYDSPVPPKPKQQSYGPEDNIDSGFDDDSIPF